MRFYFLIISSITREGKIEPREARTGADKMACTWQSGGWMAGGKSQMYMEQLFFSW